MGEKTSTFEERSISELSGRVLGEEEAVVSLQDNCGYEALRSALEEWGELNRLYEELSGPHNNWRKRHAAEKQRDNARISLVLRMQQVRLVRKDESWEVVLADEEAVLQLDPVKLTVFPDGTYVFMGTHHSSFSWELNYNAGYRTKHTYVDYEITVRSDGAMIHQRLDERQEIT